MKSNFFALIDTFADQHFSGNPAGVCILDQTIDTGVMQKFAMEVNQAETAFLVPLQDRWSLRWFTPACEVELCGHATMAAAVALWRHLGERIGELIRFETRSGELTARRIQASEQARGNWTELNFPREDVVPVTAPTGLLESLGLQLSPRGIYKNRMDYLVEIESMEELITLAPNMRKLAQFDTRGVIVTVAEKVDSPSGEMTSDFVSRFFAPRCGVDEDPATGSAHCALLPYWEERLGRSRLIGYQASKRGGWLDCEGQGQRVLLRGKSYCTVDGAFHFGG
jgi:PhzF family phenazine biosynthesis protein